MTNQHPILITGAEGQLGRILSQYLAERGPVVAFSRRELDICDPAAVAETIAKAAPSAVVNCAAYNDVDGAEDHASTALNVNALAVRSLARAAERTGALFVHFSTDFVFDGMTSRPYEEGDPPNPRSTYGASKMLGEWLAPDARRWMVLRVESLYGVAHSPGALRTGSIDRIIETLERRQQVKALTDRVVSPSYLVDVVEAVQALMQRDAPSGIYHVVNTGHCTWYELAQEIARYVGGGEGIVSVQARELRLKAPRPLFAALSNRKLAATAYEMPTWQDAIARYVAFRSGRTVGAAREPLR